MSFLSKEGIVEAVRRSIEASKPRRFKQSLDLVVVLRDIDLKSPEGRIRETIFLPHGLGKDVHVCVVAEGDMAVKAKELGLPHVITRSDLQAMSRKEARKIAQDCDWVLVRTDLMPLAGRILGPALGPRGKAPIPIPPNADIASMVERYRSAVMVRTKDQPQIMCRVGTEDMDPEKIAENILKVLSTLETRLPNPRHNIARIIIKTTMGPPIEIPI